MNIITKLLLVFFVLGNILQASMARSETPIAVAEAEEGELVGTSVATSKTGYSGSGYVTGFDNDGDKVTVTMSVPQTAMYRLTIRYHGGDGDKEQLLMINGSNGSRLFFPKTTSFENLEAGKYILEQGENTFTIQKDWGWSDIDRFEIYQTTLNQYNIDTALVDSNANDVTKELYNFLRLQFGQRIISGQTHGNYNSIKTLTGKSPRLRVGDFQHFTEGYPYLWKDGGHTFGKHDDGSVDELIDWYNATNGKGIISYQWHWHSPTGGEVSTNTFYTNQTTFDITKAVTPGTDEYHDIIRDIDDIAAELKRFQDAGVPILWRPLHEAGGGWFWWGAKGPEPCLALYDTLFHRLKNHHQLHNLIWVWSTPEADWYPGNDKVDIIGYDSYPGAYNYGPQKSVFDQLYALTDGEKLIGMTENGPIPDPQQCMAGDAPWLLFMSWSDLVYEQNSEDHIKAVYNSPLVLTLESDNEILTKEWRSDLYPENWKPGFADTLGRFLHDFSYAGYHQGEKAVPVIGTNITDVTQPPYNADNTGTADVTSIIQQALDDVGQAGGGVVYLPAGTYRLNPGNNDYALRIAYDSTVLRGAGTDSTFLLNEAAYMRQKDIIMVQGGDANWADNYGTTVKLRHDLLLPTTIIPVESVTGFEAGDEIILRTDGTEEFIAEHNMNGYWTDWSARVMFQRTIDSVDANNKLIYIDSPTRYFMKKRDNARIYHAKKHLEECGIEMLSIGNLQNNKEGWDEETFSTSGTGAYEVHASHAIVMKYCRNSWIKNVNTYKPAENTEDIHVLSNCLLINQSRGITVDSCFFQKPQYEGGGGNGYMYTLEANDCLIKNSRANHSRHNFDFKFPYSNGNVILNCIGENSKYSSDFHMYLSMANLFDGFTVNGDYLESTFRPYGGSAIHGYSSTQSVFYNTKGTAYHPNRDYIIESKQFGDGYIIGTSGTAYRVRTTPVSGTINGYSYDTSPADFVEGVGNGENLIPSSLYLDQLSKRLSDETKKDFYVTVKLLDIESKEPVTGAYVSVLEDGFTTNEAGETTFTSLPSSFHVSVEHENYIAVDGQHFVVYKDTVLTLYATQKTYHASIQVFNGDDESFFPGVNVTFGDQSINADNEGIATFDVNPGTYTYDIYKSMYEQVTGDLTVASDTTISIILQRTHANLMFRIKNEDDDPIDDIMVIVAEDTAYTSSLGYTKFGALPINNTYDYHLSRDGFTAQTGVVTLTLDTTLNITMVLIPSGIESNPLPDGLKVWPNPVNDRLFVTCARQNAHQVVNIMTITGNLIQTKKLEEGTNQIDISALSPGMYLFNFYSPGTNYSTLLIKQ